jgi:hypothetical protein
MSKYFNFYLRQRGWPFFRPRDFFLDFGAARDLYSYINGKIRVFWDYGRLNWGAGRNEHIGAGD